MRRFPRPRYTKPITGGCFSSAILIFLLALCPPLAVIFWIIYALFASGSGNASSTKNSSDIFSLLTIGFVLIASPILTILLLISGEEGITRELPFLVLSAITITEAAVVLIWAIKKHKIANKTPDENENTIEECETDDSEENDKQKTIVFDNIINPDKKESENETKSTTNVPVKTIVYITPQGKKYHDNLNCQWIKDRNDLVTIAVSEANNKNLTPCKACFRNDSCNTYRTTPYQ